MDKELTSIIVEEEQVFEVMDELYLLYYKKGDVLKDLLLEEAPVILSAVRKMQTWDNDGEEVYDLKLRMVVEDLKEIIPLQEYPELWTNLNWFFWINLIPALCAGFFIDFFL